MRSFFLRRCLFRSLLTATCANRRASGEFHHLTMLATAGLMFFVRAATFSCCSWPETVTAFTFLSLITAMNPSHPRSDQYPCSALSSSLLLLGIVLLYGVGANPEAGASYPGYESMDPPPFNTCTRMDENPTILLRRCCSDYCGHCVQGWKVFSDLGSRRLRFSYAHYRFFGRFLEGGRLFRPLNLVNGPFEGMAELLPLLGFVATFTIFFATLRLVPNVTPKRMLGLSGRRPRRIPACCRHGFHDGCCRERQ